VKAALHRGRAALRARAELSPPAPAKDPQALAEERALLHRYARLFNARDWESLRRSLAEGCRLDLVSRAERRGPAVGEDFARYAELGDFRVAPGLLDDGAAGPRPALAVHAPAASERPSTFVLLEWREGRVAVIRDFRYVSYLADEVLGGAATFAAD